MPPQLASYQKAAQNIYNPQQKAEAASLKTQYKTGVNTLESSKGAIQSDYQSAVDSVNSAISSDTAKINQLYTERLGGNFSGLQGNDLGMMYSSANKQIAGIATARADKLASIATSEGNMKLTYNTNLANLKPKYQSLESEYASKAYTGAVKDYRTQQYRSEELGLRQESLASTNAYRNAELGMRQQSLAERASAKANAPLSENQTVAAIRHGLGKVRGRDGFVAPQDFAQAYVDYADTGRNPKNFYKYFKGMMNPKNNNYQRAINKIQRG